MFLRIAQHDTWLYGREPWDFWLLTLHLNLDCLVVHILHNLGGKTEDLRPSQNGILRACRDYRLSRCGTPRSNRNAGIRGVVLFTKQRQKSEIDSQARHFRCLTGVRLAGPPAICLSRCLSLRRCVSIRSGGRQFGFKDLPIVFGRRLRI